MFSDIEKLQSNELLPYKLDHKNILFTHVDTLSSTQFSIKFLLNFQILSSLYYILKDELKAILLLHINVSHAHKGIFHHRSESRRHINFALLCSFYLFNETSNCLTVRDLVV